MPGGIARPLIMRRLIIGHLRKQKTALLGGFGMEVENMRRLIFWRQDHQNLAPTVPKAPRCLVAN